MSHTDIATAITVVDTQDIAVNYGADIYAIDENCENVDGASVHLTGASLEEMKPFVADAVAKLIDQRGFDCVQVTYTKLSQ